MQTESTAPGIALRKDLQHCPDVWYLDGSAILLAENTLFRVYSGLLAQYSTVFRDMFQIPQPDLQEQYDGLPLIELYDSAVDLRRFLIAMHNSG